MVPTARDTDTAHRDFNIVILFTSYTIYKNRVLCANTRRARNHSIFLVSRIFTFKNVQIFSMLNTHVVHTSMEIVRVDGINSFGEKQRGWLFAR